MFCGAITEIWDVVQNRKTAWLPQACADWYSFRCHLRKLQEIVKMNTVGGYG